MSGWQVKFMKCSYEIISGPENVMAKGEMRSGQKLMYVQGFYRET